MYARIRKSFTSTALLRCLVRALSANWSLAHPAIRARRCIGVEPRVTAAKLIKIQRPVQILSNYVITMITMSVLDGCPPGNYVYLEGNSAVTCDPFNPKNSGCPLGYTCQWSSSLQRYQCCGVDAPPKPSEVKQGTLRQTS